MRRVGNSVALRRVCGAGAARRTGAGGTQRLVHDLADGAGTAAALGAATETTINLSGRARRRRRAGAANGLVAQNIAGADDHRRFQQECRRFLLSRFAIGDFAASQSISQFKNVLVY